MCSIQCDQGLLGRVTPFGHPGVIALVDSFSWLFAACRVLLRFCLPRHPPCALSSFVLKSIHSIVLSLSHGGFTSSRLFHSVVKVLFLSFFLSFFHQSFCSEIEKSIFFDLSSQISKKNPPLTAVHRSLSSSPLPLSLPLHSLLFLHSFIQVGDPGLEPGASPLSEECSNQLS